MRMDWDAYGRGTGGFPITHGVHSVFHQSELIVMESVVRRTRWNGVFIPMEYSFLWSSMHCTLCYYTYYCWRCAAPADCGHGKRIIMELPVRIVAWGIYRYLLLRTCVLLSTSPLLHMGENRPRHSAVHLHQCASRASKC